MKIIAPGMRIVDKKTNEDTSVLDRNGKPQFKAEYITKQLDLHKTYFKVRGKE